MAVSLWTWWLAIALASDVRSRVCPGFFTGGQDPKAESGVGYLGRGSNPIPPARESGGALWAPPAGVRAEPRPLKGFPLFSALSMASPDTIILLTVDCRAAVKGARTPVLWQCLPSPNLDNRLMESVGPWRWQGCAREFSFGRNGRVEGQERGRDCCNPLPTQRGSGQSPTAQRFSTISALRMASPDTIVLLTVDYHAAIGARPLAPPPCVRPWLGP